MVVLTIIDMVNDAISDFQDKVAEDPTDDKEYNLVMCLETKEEADGTVSVFLREEL